MSAYWTTLVSSAFDRDRRRPQTRAEMMVAVREMAARGMTDYGIAAATCLSVEQVRRMLGESRQ